MPQVHDRGLEHLGLIKMSQNALGKNSSTNADESLVKELWTSISFGMFLWHKQK